jgi:Domain of unknown function (DUF5010)
MKTAFYPMVKLSRLGLATALLLCLAKPAFTACTCDPDVSFNTVADTTSIGAQGQVDVNLGNSTTNFINLAYEQINGSAPSAAILSAQQANFTNNTWWRRIDTVNTFLNAANSNKTKIYSDPWQVDYQFNTTPCKNVARNVGAVCMFFFSCPNGTNCQPDWANTHAYGMSTPSNMEGFGANPTGIYNSAANAGFWYRELMDARYAGLQFLMPNAYGPDITNGSIDNLATALNTISTAGTSNPVQIALFDDTSGWNSGSPAPFNSVPSFSNSAAAAASIFNNKWKPFFQKIPSQYWYTVGGKPLIYLYNAGTLTPLNQAAATVSALKTLFNTQFGVTPYVVVDRAFFADPAMATTADNEFVWDTLHSGLTNNISSYSFGGVRWDHAMVKWDPLGRNYLGGSAPNLHIANSGDGVIKDASYLANALYNSGPSGDNSSYLVLGTWNDLGEGTGINRNYDYYVNGAWQPPNYYMDYIRASQSTQSCGVILPTVTPTPVQGPIVTTFDSSNSSLNLTEWSGGSILTAFDTAGSTMTQNPWAYATGTAVGNGGGKGGRISGTLAKQVVGPPAVNPYAFLSLELKPGGSIPTNANVSVVAQSPNQGLSFDYKAAVAGVTYRVELVEKDGATTFNYTYFQYVFTAPDTAWHTVVVYFPTITGGANHFTRPGGGTFDPTMLGAVQFQVQPSSAATVPYDLTVDNVTFAVPVAPPPPTLGPLITDFETTNAQANHTEWNSGSILTAFGAAGTTMTQNPWSWAGTGTVVGNGGGKGGHISGNLAQQVIATSTYPYAYLGLELTPGGSIPTNANVNVAAVATTHGLQFDYKAGVAGVQYRVDLVERDGATTFAYTYFQYVFTAPDTAWHTVDVYFPTEPGGQNHFTRPGGGTFDPTVLGAVLFQVQPLNTGTVAYDLTVDNVTFDCPPAPTPTPTQTVTPTSTPSRTPTASPSLTATITVSPSPSNSPSPSPSFTRTITPSVSPSPSSTNATSSTSTQSPSPSPSVTRTLTPSNSPSPSPSFTSASSPSSTVTGSSSPTRTLTPSISPSPSAVVTNTDTATRSVTSSVTATPAGTLTNTPSFSVSPTRTGTATVTPSISPSISPSITRTVTASPSPSQTALGSFTITVTSTVTPTSAGSPTSTITRTVTQTLTPSSTGTASISPSPSRTPSNTVVVTLTDTPSVTPTITPTSTISVTANGTFTITLTATPSPSLTASPSVTRTLTPSDTQTSGPSATSTATPSQTTTNTALVTATFSSTITSSFTDTATLTPTFTLTLSPTLTPTQPATATLTPNLTQTALAGSATPNLTQTAVAGSATPNLTQTAVAGSATPNLTQTAVAGSATPNLTQTALAGSVTPNLTQTALAASATANLTQTALASSPTPTLTLTPTQVQTAGLTADPTAALGGIYGPPRFIRVVPVPNPQHGNRLNFGVNLASPADEVELKLYGRSMTLVGSFRCEGTFNTGWSQAGFNLTVPLSTGLYYARLTPYAAGDRGERSEIVKVFYLP